MPKELPRNGTTFDKPKKEYSIIFPSNNESLKVGFFWGKEALLCLLYMTSLTIVSLMLYRLEVPFYRGGGLYMRHLGMYMQVSF